MGSMVAARWLVVNTLFFPVNGLSGRGPAPPFLALAGSASIISFRSGLQHLSILLRVGADNSAGLLALALVGRLNLSALVDFE